MKKPIQCAISLVWIFITAFSGCKTYILGRTEIDRIEFIRAVGVDILPDEEKRIKLTIATIRLYSTGSEEGQQKKSEIITSDGRTVFEAVRNLWNHMDRRPFWGHVEYMIIGEETAAEGLLKYIDYFSRDPEVRLNLKVFVAKNQTAEDIIMMGNGKTSFIFEKLQGLTENQWGQSISNVINLIEVMYILDRTYLNLYLPCIELKNKSRGLNDADSLDIDLAGFALFKGDKLAAYLDSKMGRGLNWLRNKIESGIIPVKSPEGSDVSLEIINGTVKFEPKIIGDKIHFSIKVNMGSTVGGVNSDEDIFNGTALDYLNKQQKQYILDEITQVLRFAQQNKMDFFSCGDAVYHKYPILWEDKLKKDWKDHFANIQFEVDITSNIYASYNIKEPSRNWED